MGRTSEIFRSHLRELWPAVEPHWTATVLADIDAVRAALDSPLAETPRAKGHSCSPTGCTSSSTPTTTPTRSAGTSCAPP